MTRMLVVAGTVTNGVLSTSVPVPTDGQPEWGRCQACGVRAKATLHHHPEVDSFEPMSFDGPFPVTVAVWQECATCEGYGYVDTGGDPGYDTVDCPTCGGSVGAVVATVEVTGPSLYRLGDDGHFTWHTPTGEVTWLDTPIPMERPWLHANGGECPTARCDICIDPAPSWWADVDIKEHTR